MARSTSNESGRRARPRMQAKRSKSDSSIPKKRKRQNSKTRCSTAHEYADENELKWPKILGIPIKSPNDENEYRIIQLSNGIRAILISDIPCLNKPRKIQRNRKCLDKAIVDFNADIVGVEVRDSPKDARPTSSQTRIRTVSRPRSRPKIHVVGCDCQFSPTGVTVNIGSGNFQDPKELLGLAHLMEHLIFYGGSEKYPDCRFMEFLIENHSLLNNAITRGSDVAYYIGFDSQAFHRFMDTFVNLFVSPTLHLKDIKTEREAVDTEYLDERHQDMQKISRMYQICMKADHPAQKFHIGSKETLVTSDGKDETLRKILLDYLDKEYGAGSTVVSIHAPEPLDVIQESAVKYFGQIPKRTPKVVEPLSGSLASDPAKFRCFYRVKPTLDKNKLFVAWDLPLRTALNYETKPLVYLERLIHTEAPGGLVSYLKKKKWISKVKCAVPDFNDNEYSSALFRIEFSLQNTETKIVFKILEALYSYLKFLVEVGPQEWYFNEIRWIRSLNFHFFSEYDDPLHNSPVQASNLRNYPPEDCLIGGPLVTKWDPSLITYCLKLLTPGTANVIIMSKSVQNCNFVEPFYDVQYGVMDNDNYKCWVKRWAKIKAFKEFQFPCPNPFITTSFCGIEPDSQGDLGCEDEVGRLIHIVKNEKIKFFNLKQKSEEAKYVIGIRTSVPLYTTQNNILLKIWVRLLHKILQPLLYGVEEALLKYSISESETGIFYKVSGFGQHLHLIVFEILNQIEHLIDTVTADMFEAEKHDVLSYISNYLIEPRSLALYATKSNHRIIQYTICFENTNLRWPDTYNTLVVTTFEDFQRFCVEFKERLFIGVIGVGDVDRETSLTLADDIIDTLNYEPLLPSFTLGQNRPKIAACQLPLGDTIVRVRSRDLRNSQSHIRCIYQIQDGSKIATEICTIIAALLRFPAFNELRRKQDLCYQSSVFWKKIGSRPTLMISVESHSHKFCGTDVKNKIDTFVKKFFETEMREITQAKINDYTFSKISLEQVLEYYEKYLLPGPTSEMRKLTIQVVGMADREFSQEYVQDLSSPGRGNRKLKKIDPSDISVTVLAPNKNEQDPTCTPERQQYIRNIMDFKSQLFTYPKYDLDMD